MARRYRCTVTVPVALLDIFWRKWLGVTSQQLNLGITGACSAIYRARIGLLLAHKH